MVVPVGRSAQQETKQYVGNNLFLSFHKNCSKLVVIGNRCSVEINENFGTVKVIGNDSSVSISKCLGSVEYIGNNGIIHFDRVTSQDQINYIGSNGSLLCKKAKKQSKTHSVQPPRNQTEKKLIVGDKVRFVHSIDINSIDLNDHLTPTLCSCL
ncbi:hypothetical protein YQE_10468, partial [Dendroctonus ponderosae]